MEILYQILLTLLIALVGAILWASMYVFKNLLVRVFLQTLVILGAGFIVAEYVWSDFTFGEILAYVFDTIFGWVLLLGGLYLLLMFGGLRERNMKALVDIERLKEKLKRR